MPTTDAPLRLLLVRTTAAAAEALEAMLEDHGALGSAIERRRGARLVRLQAYFPPEGSPPVDWVREKLNELHANGIPVGPAEVRLLPLPQEDWGESWKRHFRPMQITPRLWITPAWESIEVGAGASMIRIEPGMAFGWGDHPTTRGCLVMLERIEPMRLPPGGFRTADVGCGTGVLAIRALQLGLGPVDAFDTDPEATRTCRENAELNGAGDGIVPHEGTLPPGGVGPYRLILANIFLTILEQLLPRFGRLLAPGGELVAAGITDDQEDRFRESLTERGLRVIDRLCERAQPGGRRWPVLRMRNDVDSGG
jgi:ribosomal protein L11 methyltransferase